MTRERKRLASIRSEINLELNTVRFWAFDYSTEKPVPGLDFRLDANKVNPALHRYAILDGLKDSIRDAGALGADASMAKKFAAMRERAEYLESGADTWARNARETGEGTLLFKALMRQDPTRDEAKISAFVRKLDRTTRDKMLNDERLSSIVAELRAELGKQVDLTETWKELEMLDAE